MNPINRLRNAQTTSHVAAHASQPVTANSANAADVIGSVKLTRMQDGFDGLLKESVKTVNNTAKPKKKKKSFWGKLGGFFKKALGVVAGIAKFVPGLNLIAKPLELVSTILK